MRIRCVGGECDGQWAECINRPGHRINVAKQTALDVLPTSLLSPKSEMALAIEYHLYRIELIRCGDRATDTFILVPDEWSLGAVGCRIIQHIVMNWGPV